jgi:segregation and condensation protein B
MILVDNLTLHIESLIFVANPSISFDDIKGAIEETFGTTFLDEQVNSAIKTIEVKYANGDYSFELVEIGGGFRFMTKASFHNTIGTYLKQNTNKKLSKSALETLSIIAYKQPTSKSEVESIRGVNCDYTVQKLLEKDLIEISGRSSGPGKPLLYATTQKFMDYFGITGIEDLPKIKEIQAFENQVGEQAPIEEDMSNILLSKTEEE